MFADVVFNKPIMPFTYELGDNFPGVSKGMRVAVDLRDKETVGIIYRTKETPDKTNIDFKPVKAVLDSEPVLNEDLIETGEWMARHYLCSVGEALWTIIPKGFKKRDKKLDIEGHFTSNRSSEEIMLTEEQRIVFKTLMKSFDNEGPRHFLLHGVTGSGKTEIYLRIIDEVLKRGRGAILLVPEISLTPQTIGYFSKRMGDQLAILHSRLTKAEKINEWFRIQSGEKRIVIGARSAMFAPMKDIGIIIIDEEHETSYKSDETPRYSAKGLAYYRAQKHGATLLLGSATPSIESYYLAKLKKFTLLELPSRVLDQKLPTTRVADLRRIKENRYISTALIKAIEKRLKKREQIILFLNRRGFSPYVFCENCGYVFKCENCDITLTYHKRERDLRCHYCGYLDRPRESCPECGDDRIRYSGFGTEKIEGILKEYFPGAVVERMDTDTVKSRSSIAKILTAFSKKEIDILIGTQMVTKGLHFPDVTLVGVLNADISLNFPDFRSAERTFNLITQVSGRAGRSEKGGEVIIQTYNPAHYSVQTAKNQDYGEFFEREIKYRQNLVYPPFCRIIRLVFRGGDSKKLFETAYTAISFIQEKTKSYMSILGPAFCPFSRIKKYFRVHIIIKVEQLEPVKSILKELNSSLNNREQYMEIDIDPISML
jgi:primosomal protein N' (replication factor Y)